MIKLLRAEFKRMVKDVTFWILILMNILISVFILTTRYADVVNYKSIIELDSLLTINESFIGVFIAIFAALFIGREYSDGTLRNKIILNIDRTKIFLVELIVVFTASVLFEFVYFFLTLLVGIPLFGNIQMSLPSLGILLICITAIILADASIFTFIAMSISNKTVSAIISILLVFIMEIVSLTLIYRIQEPEYITVASINPKTNEYELTEQKNPKYCTESQKDFLMQLVKTIPGGQCLLIAGRMETDINTLPLYSLGITFIFTSTGILLFRRKELK